MNIYLLLIGLTTILIYSMIHLGRSFFSKNILIVLGMSFLMGFFVFKYDYFSWAKYFGAVFFLFIAGISFYYSKQILPAISERILHIISIIYIYQIIINYEPFYYYLYFFLLIPAIIIIYYSISIKPINIKEKVLLYSVFIYILLYIDFYNLKMLALYNFPQHEPNYIDYNLILSTIFISIILYYITIYIFNLLQVITFRYKNESYEDYKSRFLKESSLFIEKFSNKQAKPLHTIVLTILLLVIILLNVIYQYIRSNFITEYLLGFILICFQNKKLAIPIVNKLKKTAHHFI